MTFICESIRLPLGKFNRQQHAALLSVLCRKNQKLQAYKHAFLIRAASYSTIGVCLVPDAGRTARHSPVDRHTRRSVKLAHMC